MANSSEEQELASLNTIEFRVAQVNTDAKLTALLDKQLTEVLSKLASPSARVRSKVVAICQHINQRIKPPHVQLPVASLVEQLQKHMDVSLVVNFDLIYVRKGIKRLTPSSQANLVPTLLKGISATLSDSFASRGQIFHLLLLALVHYPLPAKGSKEDGELRERLGIMKGDAKALSTAFGKLMLFAGVRQANNEALSSPGLSSEDLKFLNLPGMVEPWKADSEIGLALSVAKFKVLEFLASGVFTDDERFLPALYASADSNSQIAERAEQILKYSTSKVNMEDASLVQGLFDMYGKAKPALQIKILGYLSRSKISTIFNKLFLNLFKSGIIGQTQEHNGHPTKAGLETTKLRSAIFTYAGFWLRNASKQCLQEVAEPLLQQLRNFIIEQGWPNPRPNQDITLRRSAYVMIGLAAKSGRIADMALLRWLFESLRDDASGNETAISIQECLSSLHNSYATAAAKDKDFEKSLADLLLEFMQVNQSGSVSEVSLRRNTRFASVYFANSALSYENTTARWMNILALEDAPDDRREIAEEGKRGLDPYLAGLLNLEVFQTPTAVKFPNFVDAWRTFFVHSDDFSTLSAVKTAVMSKVSTLVQNFQNQHSSIALATALQFCKHLLLREALEQAHIHIVVDQNWAEKLHTALTTATPARNAIKTYISSLVMDQSTSLEKTCAFLTLMHGSFLSLRGHGLGDSTTDNIGCEEIFINILPLISDEILYSFPSPPAADLKQLSFAVPDEWICNASSPIAFDFKQLLSPLSSNNQNIRRASARAFGTLFSVESKQPIDDRHQKYVDFLLDKATAWRSQVGQGLNPMHGYIEALAIALTRCILRNGKDLFPKETQTLVNVVKDIIKNSSDAALLDAALTAVEQFGMFTEYGKQFAMNDPTSASVVEEISAMSGKANETAIRVLGRLSIRLHENITDESAVLDRIDEILYGLNDLRQPEAQFTVGEAICCLASSWNSKALEIEVGVDAKPPKALEREKTLTRILARTIRDCQASKPALRKASVIWLLSIVQYCGHRREVQDQLLNCQGAFIQCLTDRDDFVQQISSSGLEMVYDKATSATKAALVKQLVGSFAGIKTRIEAQSTIETVLLESVSSRTRDGSSTAHKDLLSLASEVGDPSLVYRFLSLSANSSRPAFGKLGPNVISEDSNVNATLDDNSKIYPKLYRYRFDPNPTVQRRMKEIWDALVKDQSRTLEEYFDPIMEELLRSILAKDSRVREASCAALGSLITGTKFQRYERYYSDIWERCFKVLDDMLPSVQIAAIHLAKTLTEVLVRMLESGDSSPETSSAMLEKSFAFLLSRSGIEASAKQVQAFALGVLLDIVKKASGTILQPFIPDLVERLVAFSSDFEWEGINYVHLNASQYNTTAEEIDTMRLKMIRSSPLTEAIDRCLDLVTTKNVEQLAESIERAMKVAIALPSKVVSSRILVSMSLRHNLFEPYADRFLALLRKSIIDRNDTVSDAYATAAGYLSRIASDTQILELINFARKIYQTSDSDRERLISGATMEAISKYAAERVQDGEIPNVILPFVFVAKHDGTASVKEVYQSAWENFIGRHKALSDSLSETVTAIQDFLESPRWNLKQTAARAIAEATNEHANNRDGISDATAGILWPALKTAMGGRSWEGKEVVLQAFTRFICITKVFWNEKRPDIKDEIKKVHFSRSFRFSCFQMATCLHSLVVCLASGTAGIS